MAARRRQKKLIKTLDSFDTNLELVSFSNSIKQNPMHREINYWISIFIKLPSCVHGSPAQFVLPDKIGLMQIFILIKSPIVRRLHNDFLSFVKCKSVKASIAILIHFDRSDPKSHRRNFVFKYIISWAMHDECRPSRELSQSFSY